MFKSVKKPLSGKRKVVLLLKKTAFEYSQAVLEKNLNR